MECKSETDRDILEKELSKLRTLNVGRPRKKLPTLLLSFVPKEVEDADIKHTILQQNNLIHLEDSILHTKFTKRTFEDSRHVIVEVNPGLRRELLALKKIKIQWCMCRVEDFVAVNRCLKCLGFGHTARFCQKQQKCSLCAGEHYWKDSSTKHLICCSNCTKANTYIHEENKKTDTNHSVFRKEFPRLRRIEALIRRKTNY